MVTADVLDLVQDMCGTCMAGCEQNWDNSFWNKCKLRDCWFGRYESVGLVVGMMSCTWCCFIKYWRVNILYMF